MTKWRKTRFILGLVIGIPLTIWGIYSIRSIDHGGDKGATGLLNLFGLLAGTFGFYAVVSGISILFTGKEFVPGRMTTYYCPFCKHPFRQLPDPGKLMKCPKCTKMVRR